MPIKKRYILFIPIFSLILALSIMITVYADGGQWSISDFLYRYLSGGDNGIYYTFDAGDQISMSGHFTYISENANSTPKPSNITVVLYRERWGTDKKIGSFTVSSPDADGNAVLTKDFSGSFGTADADSSKYYLVFYKNSGIDYWTVSGSGDLTE